MSDARFELLPEGLDPAEIVDDLEFTEVTNHDEVYTLFRIVRFTHAVFGHPEGWTHMANVVRVRRNALGTALLRIADRSIEESSVTVSDIGR